MRDYAIETYPSAFIEFGLLKEEFINLTFAEYQDVGGTIYSGVYSGLYFLMNTKIIPA